MVFAIREVFSRWNAKPAMPIDYQWADTDYSGAGAGQRVCCDFIRGHDRAAIAEGACASLKWPQDSGLAVDMDNFCLLNPRG